MALGHDGSPQATAKVFREFVQLGIAINLNGLLGCVADNVAVVAPSEMVFQFRFCSVVNDAVQVVS
jgi:hypothetical protein